MNVTEKEAINTMYCPMSMGRPAMVDAVGGSQEPGGPFTCWGSRCMAWRWSDRSGEWAASSPGPEWEEEPIVGGHRMTLKTDEGLLLKWRRKERIGHCGMVR